MSTRETTMEAPDEPPEAAEGAPVPGILILGPDHRATSGVLRVVALSGRTPVVLGRGSDADVAIQDDELSRRHLSVSHDRAAFHLEDLESRNGTTLDGRAVEGVVRAAPGGVARVGSHLLHLFADVRPFLGGQVVQVEGMVIGPRFARALATLERFGRTSSTVFIGGETGTGKELAARAFHRAATTAGAPFLPVNCAAVPHALSERLFFGVKRGAYSGADADADGYLHVASGGTLFLDEVAELDLAVQAKLLRVLESEDVYRLGATRPEKVSLRLCSATHKDLRSEVAAGRFREDLFHRLGRPGVRLPPLRERPEEIPFLIGAALAAVGDERRVHPSFVAACLARSWSGNVRELIGAVRDAAVVADIDGPLRARDLDPEVGWPLDPARREQESADGKPTATLPADAIIERALSAATGNTSAAARALGVHRTQLRRWLAQRARRGGAPQ